MCVCWPHPSGLFGQNEKKEGGRKIQERRVLEKNGFSRDQREEGKSQRGGLITTSGSNLEQEREVNS